MRPSSTSAVTDRRRAGHDQEDASSRTNLAVLLVVELICALFVVGRPQQPPAGPVPAGPASPSAALPASPSAAMPSSPSSLMPTPTAASTTETLTDGRTVHLIGLGGAHTSALLARIATEMNGAAQAVTAFWGPDWPRDVVIVAAASDAEFGVLAGGGPDIAATTTSERIMFASGAAAMSDASLRIVVRHELFHYASRAETAADAPRWLVEGVADFVGRPPQPRPPDAGNWALPTDADLSAPGPAGSQAYDRAWWFSRFVADAYGTATLRALYLRACGPGHPDAATAVRDTLGVDLPTVLARWRHWLSG
jgi:hypothetical protein